MEETGVRASVAQRCLIDILALLDPLLVPDGDSSLRGKYLMKDGWLTQTEIALFSDKRKRLKLTKTLRNGLMRDGILNSSGKPQISGLLDYGQHQVSEPHVPRDMDRLREKSLVEIEGEGRRRYRLKRDLVTWRRLALLYLETDRFRNFIASPYNRGHPSRYIDTRSFYDTFHAESLTSQGNDTAGETFAAINPKLFAIFLKDRTDYGSKLREFVNACRKAGYSRDEAEFVLGIAQEHALMDPETVIRFMGLFVAARAMQRRIQQAKNLPAIMDAEIKKSTTRRYKRQKTSR